MTRRTLLTMATFGAAGVLACRPSQASEPVPAPAAAEPAPPGEQTTGAPATVTIVEYSDAGVVLAVKTLPKVVRPESEWRRDLSAMSFEVTRHADTEAPFSGATWNLHDKGLYRCVCCATALFSSETKFDSGTGWPSFWAPLDKRNIEEHVDSTLGMKRTEVLCHLCDAHLGHVFDDGPKPTGLRYCMNSAAMRFVKA